jgi:hypothetical protein
MRQPRPPPALLLLGLWVCGWWPVAASAGKSANFLSSGAEQSCPEGWDKGVGPAEFVVFTVVRDEQPYIEEFVQYHLFIGVDLIYIYGTCSIVKHVVSGRGDR